jgi:ankyrin repeat protein
MLHFSVLVQAGAPLDSQDMDGWTPLHAASHWAQREACQMLAEAGAAMDVKNYVGQTCFDVADPDVLRLLDDLKRKQKDSNVVAARNNSVAVAARTAAATAKEHQAAAAAAAAAKRRYADEPDWNLVTGNYRGIK